MSVLLRCLTVLVAASAPWLHPAHAAHITSHRMVLSEGARHFLLAMPQQAAPGKRPLVIVLHGHSGTAEQVFGRARIHAPMQVWLDIADREQVLVIAPDGVKGSDGQQGWNDCRADAPTNPHTDDVGFVGALIDQAVAEHGADPSRVYVMGMSNGGGMVYRLATEMAPRLAGVAAVAAMWPAKSLCPKPQHALPVLVVHGTADKFAPFNGGEVGHFPLRGRGSAISTLDAVAIWRKLAQLPASSVDTGFPHRDASDKTTAHRSVWGADPHGVQVEMVTVVDGGHTEPSIRRRLQGLYTAVLGAQNGDVEIAEEAWSFFKDKRAAIRP